MDYVLEFCDREFFTPYVYPADWPESDLTRQYLSLMAVMILGGWLVYLIPAALNYYFIYDHNLMKHPKFLKHQVFLEIQVACTSVPFMAIPTVALFVAELQGYSKLYDDASEHGGYGFLAISFVTFLLFTVS